MSDRSDTLLRRLSRIDPTEADPAPAKGSPRHHSILEATMRTAKYPDPTTATDPPPAGLRFRQRLLIGAAAAVVVAAVAVAIVLTQPQNALTPEAALAAAATNIGEANTVRGTLSERGFIYGDAGNLNQWVVSGTVELEKTSIRATITEQWGQDEPLVDSFTIIGDRKWVTESDGSITSDTLSSDPLENLAPFTEASKALLEVAMSDANAANLGSETVRDRPATHYRLDPVNSLNGPLTQLSPSVLGWFQLEGIGVENVRVVVDVWVSNGAIVRMTVEQILRDNFAGAANDWTMDVEGDEHSTTTFEFYDYGADIHVEPPATS